MYNSFRLYLGKMVKNCFKASQFSIEVYNVGFLQYIHIHGVVIACHLIIICCHIVIRTVWETNTCGGFKKKHVGNLKTNIVTARLRLLALVTNLGDCTLGLYYALQRARLHTQTSFYSFYPGEASGVPSTVLRIRCLRHFTPRAVYLGGSHAPGKDGIWQTIATAQISVSGWQPLD